MIEKSATKKPLPHIRFGLSWIIIIPGAIWGILGYYLPLLGGTLDRISTYIVAAACLFLALASLFLHLLAHLVVAWLTEKKLPTDMSILIFGDASQRWPAASSNGHEALITIAGPLINLILAGLAYFAWNAQTNNVIGLSLLFLCGFNGWLFVINLIPAYPMDGGRIILATLARSTNQPAGVTKWARNFGWAIVAALTGWGVFLILQHARFSLATGLITFLFAIILIDGIRFHPTRKIPALEEDKQSSRFRVFRGLAAALLCLVLLVGASGFLLSNDGLDAPGVALSIGPMIKVPEKYRHSITGEYFLVTVISQAPITAGEWVLGKVDPAFQVVPPEQVTPKNTSPQEQARQDYQMLDDLETTAIAVGLRLAGYPDALVGKGVTVDSILTGGHAQGLLQPGDIITGLNGNPIQTTDELINGIKT